MKVAHRIYTLPAILFALLNLARVRGLEYGQACETPFEEIGQCVRIRYCPKFADIPTSQDSIPVEVLNTLNQSLCGRWKGYPLICCPSETKETSTTTTSLSVEYGESCRTPERRRGSCIRVAQCSRFAHIVGKEIIPQSTVAILNESYCGIYGKVPLICCPSDSTPTATTSTSTTPTSTTVAYNGICWTPNAVKGKCIKVRDCPQFAEALIREPDSESIQEALNESFCGIRRKHKLVCCPDDVKITQTTPAEPVIEAIETGLSCQTPTGETGTCMSEIDCLGHHAVSLPHNSQPTSNKKSFCGVKDGARLVCCPPASDHAKTEATCKNPSGEDGKCISLDECSALSSLVDPKCLTKHTLQQLQKLHCGPLDNDNMYCCPSSTADNDRKQHPNLYLLDQNNCGKSPLFKVLEDRAEIGKKAKLSTIPWMALIAYNSDTISPFRCVGSIINRRYILTAARCVSNLSSAIQPVSIRLGEHNLQYALDCTDDTCAPAPQNIFIEKIIPHPEFIGKPSYLNDIAIIRLSEDINFKTGSVQPVCLPTEETLQAKDYTNKSLLVSGWFTSTDELSPELLQDVVQGVSHKICSEAYENVTVISPNSHMCVHNGRGDDCLGKGASPLISFEVFHGRKAAVQQGIGLFGPDICYLTTQPVVYTRVGKFMNWILDNLRP